MELIVEHMMFKKQRKEKCVDQNVLLKAMVLVVGVELLLPTQRNGVGVMIYVNVLMLLVSQMMKEELVKKPLQQDYVKIVHPAIGK